MALSLPFHDPPSISREDFELSKLKPLSHSREAISKAVIAHVEHTIKCESSELPLRAQRAFELLRTQPLWILGNIVDLMNLTTFFDIFNDIYFNGVLKGFCKIKFVEKLALQRRFLCLRLGGFCEPFFPGSERDTRCQRGKVMCRLSVASEAYRANEGPWLQIRSYLEVLLHEMSHALFDIYTCRCDKGCRQKYQVEGGGGHHVPWQAAAKCIKQAPWFGPRYPSFALNLYTLSSLVGDLQLGLNLPPPHILTILGMDIVVIRDLLKTARTRKAADEKRMRSLLVPSTKTRCIRNEWTVDQWDRNFGFDKRKWNQGRTLDCDAEDFQFVWRNKTLTYGEKSDFEEIRRFENRAAYKYRNVSAILDVPEGKAS